MRRRPETSLFVKHPAVRLVLSHAVLGSMLGWAFALALVYTDAHGIGTLIRESDSGLTAFILLAGGFAVTFGSLVAGGAVMLLSDDDGRSGGLPIPTARLVPVPVRARRQPQRRID